MPIQKPGRFYFNVELSRSEDINKIQISDDWVEQFKISSLLEDSPPFFFYALTPHELLMVANWLQRSMIFINCPPSNQRWI